MRTFFFSAIVLLLFSGPLSAQQIYTISVAANTNSVVSRAEIVNNPVIMITELGIPVSSFLFIYLNRASDLIEIPSSSNTFTQTMLDAIANPYVKYFWIDEAVFMLNGIKHTAASKKIAITD